MKPVVSILIPAYNAEEWIADTIRSALAQTWPDKEIIIVDDGSTDHTLSVAQQFASREVTVITQANQGAAAARNKAYSLCHGDYIQWLDADDLLAPDKIERQMETAAQCQSKRTLLSSAWGHFMRRPQGAKFIPSPLWFDLPPVEWLVHKMGQNLHMQTSTWLVSRELTEAAGPWDNRLSLDDDGEYFCRVLLASNGTRFVPKARVFYRMSGLNSLSSVGYSVKKLESQFLSMSLHVKYVRSLEDSERVRSACVKYLNTWLPAFYRQSPDLVERLERLAEELGGRLETPVLPWKYAWIEKVFGWAVARRTQLFLPMFKQSLHRVWDNARLRFDRKISPDHRNI